MMNCIDRYNEIVGGLYKLNPDLFMYSPAFCRCEGQTYLYLRWVSKKRNPKSRYLVGILRLAGKVVRDTIYSLLAQRASVPECQGVGVFVFSFFDERNISDGELREEYFRGILDNNPDVFCFYKLISPGMFRRGARYIRQISKLKKNFHAYTEYSFVNPLMIFKALLLSLVHLYKFSVFKFKDGIDVSLVALLKSEHYKEILDGTIYDGYLQKLLYEKILRCQPRLILSVWENQPWNRILECEKKRLSPSSVSSGFQHTGFSKKLLQHYPSSVECDLDTYPDNILCNGHFNRDELSHNSVISSKLIIGSALRQEGLLRKGVEKIVDLVPESPINIAYAFSWDQSSYNGVLRDLELLPSNVTVHLKFHPIYPHWLNKNDFPARFINSHAPWSEIALHCPLVLVNDNSLMFEGYYYGMHTAIYDGVDPFGLEKRDFESPIVHLSRIDLPFLLKQETIGRINRSTQLVLETEYLSKYFVQRNLADSKKIFLDLHREK